MPPRPLIGGLLGGSVLGLSAVDPAALQTREWARRGSCATHYATCSTMRPALPCAPCAMRSCTMCRGQGNGNARTAHIIRHRSQQRAHTYQSAELSVLHYERARSRPCVWEAQKEKLKNGAVDKDGVGNAPQTVQEGS
uniref:Secreted protein n=1 Tax=Eutreptiella gymnastica TaxID=73025 RepID=A0A7S4LEI7_9EUGL